MKGRTSFFVIQPKFTNLDIRLTIDITSGALNVYITYSSEFFKITTNGSSAEHVVELDDAGLYEETYRSRRGSDQGRERRTAAQELSAPMEQVCVPFGSEWMEQSFKFIFVLFGIWNSLSLSNSNPHCNMFQRSLYKDPLFVKLQKIIHPLAFIGSLLYVGDLLLHK